MTASVPTTAPRVTPPLVADERAMLAAWLDCREIVAAAVSLDDTFDHRGERVSLRG